MSGIESYRDLVAWQRAMDLAVAVHEITRRFPTHEQFGLTIQLRRASVSVPSNVAEGRERGTTPDFLRHLTIAKGSLAEVETQLLLAVRFGYVRQEDIADVLACAGECGRVMNGLMNSLRVGGRKS
jgi:four helix bundle protein